MRTRAGSLTGSDGTRLDRRRFLAGPRPSPGRGAGRTLRRVRRRPGGRGARSRCSARCPTLRTASCACGCRRASQYRSFHDTEQPVTLDDGTVLPGRHDGMAAFRGRRGNVVLVRNHEVNNPVPAFGDAVQAYDPMAGGGTTTIEVTRLRRGRPRLHQPQRHADELLGRADAVGQLGHLRGDGQRARRRPRLHRRLQHPAHPAPRLHLRGAGRRASRPASRSPQAGRFAHEAVAFDPSRGVLYLTEDNFGFPSGLYRYMPDEHPLWRRRLGNGGPAADAGRQGRAQRRPGRHPARGRHLPGDVGRHRRPRPHLPVHARPDGAHDEQRRPSTTSATRAGPRARPGSRGWRAAVYDRGVVYFCSTQGGGPAEPGASDTVQGWGNGFGQIWAYDTRSSRLRARLPVARAGRRSTSPTTSRPASGGTLVLCEDNTNDNYLRGLTRTGELFDIALNRLVEQHGRHRFDDEFAGRHVQPGRRAPCSSTSRPAGA